MSGPNRPDHNRGGDDKRKPPIGFLGIVLWAVVLVMLLNTCVNSMQNASNVTVEYSVFRTWVSEGHVEEVRLESNAYYFTLKEGSAPLQEYAQEISEAARGQDNFLGQLFAASADVISEGNVTLSPPPSTMRRSSP